MGLDKAAKGWHEREAVAQYECHIGAYGKARPQGCRQSDPDIADMKLGVLHVCHAPGPELSRCCQAIHGVFEPSIGQSHSEQERQNTEANEDEIAGQT